MVESPIPLQSFEFDVITVDERGQEVERKSGQAQYFREDLGNRVSLDMVSIPDGGFLMGCPEGEGYNYEKPQHKVTVKPLYMGKYLVTQAQWKTISSLPKVYRDLEPNPSGFKGDDLPVENISWDDVVEFCARLSKKTGKKYRLPTEAEWEYACRGRTNTPFHCGETITSVLANYNGRYIYANEPIGEYLEKTTPVGSFLPNSFGLYDMHGNVWEWCQDNWHENYQGAPIDGSAFTTKNGNIKVIRGGSFVNDPWICRSAYRDQIYSNISDSSLGFRVVCSAP